MDEVEGSSHLVFTYGTLKQNEPNDHYLRDLEEGKAEYLGQATTVKKYPLVVASEYNIPFVLREEGKGLEIEGEVYSVDDSVLGKLDILENHPNMYRREKVPVNLHIDKDGYPVDPPKEKLCWIYLLHDYREDLLKLKLYNCYHNESQDHGAYVPRCKRDGEGKIVREQVKRNL